MSIPLKKPIVLLEYKYNKITLTEKYEDKILDESLHTFDQQHELSEYLAGFAIDCIKQNKESFILNIEKFKLPLKKVELTIARENLINRVSANINKIDSDGNAELLLNMYIHIGLILHDNEKFVFLETKEAIMHELGHWYFILTKYNNSGVVDATANNNLYQEIAQMMRNDSISPNLYYILYAIYAIFGNELNAFVSQCNCEVYNYLLNQKEISIKTVRNALLRSDTYDTFKTNIENIKNIINNTIDEKQKIVSEFNGFVLNKENCIQNIQQLNKYLKFALERNKEALRFCEQTAVNAYYKIKNK